MSGHLAIFQGHLVSLSFFLFSLIQMSAFSTIFERVPARCYFVDRRCISSGGVQVPVPFHRPAFVRVDDPLTDFNASLSDTILGTEEQQSWFEDLDSVEWPKRQSITMFGKEVELPRECLAFIDTGSDESELDSDSSMYRFPGSDTCATMSMNTKLRDLTRRVEQAFGLPAHSFNFCLINRYADKQSTITAHRDKTDTLEPNTPIVTLSIGATREFVFALHPSGARRIGYKKVTEAKKAGVCVRHKFLVQSGDAIMFSQDVNSEWTHSIPRSKVDVGVRFSLTFRKVVI